MFETRIYEMATNVLKEDKTLLPYHDCYRYALSDYPARGVNLRGMTDYNVEIYCGTDVIGELDPIGARGTLYKDAIYQHLGKRYMSMELDLEKKLCRVDSVDVDYYTEAVWENRIEMTEEEEQRDIQNVPLKYGYVHVNKQPKLYKKIRERSYENIGYGPITLPPFEYDTTGFSILPPSDWQAALDKEDKRYAGAALYGLSYLLRRTAPSLCMADKNDIETDVSLYDAHEGGVGYAEKIYELFEAALALCLEILDECTCTSGCPSCIPPLPPGVVQEEIEELMIESDAAVRCTHSLLTKLTQGTVVIPEISYARKPIASAVEAPSPDIETIRMKKRLSKAADILKRKREREH
jgi:DEAD/DEAH box helicase domain-containing protein